MHYLAFPWISALFPPRPLPLVACSNHSPLVFQAICLNSSRTLSQLVLSHEGKGYCGLRAFAIQIKRWKVNLSTLPLYCLTTSRFRSNAYLDWTTLCIVDESPGHRSHIYDPVTEKARPNQQPRPYLCRLSLFVTCARVHFLMSKLPGLIPNKPFAVS